MAATRRTSVRVRLVAMLFVISAIAFLDRTNISVAGLQMRRDYAIDPIQLGWVFSAFLIGYAAFQIPAGWLAARIGPRLLLTLALFAFFHPVYVADTIPYEQWRWRMWFTSWI